MSSFDIRDLNRRRYAHPFDHAVPYQSQTHGHDHSPNAIGGSFGIQWDEVFRDRNTGELYTVHCYDGVNRSKDARDPANEDWVQDAQERIIRRTKGDAHGSAPVIRLSREEWAIMSGRMFHDWFDKLDNEQYETVGDANRYKLDGEVGTINGVRVVIDVSAENPLGDPPCDTQVELQQALARIDRDEDMAESFGY